MLMPTQSMQLPKTESLLSKILFPEASAQRIPVTEEFYAVEYVRDHEYAAKYLVSTDGSDLPAAMTFLLRKQVVDGSTEMSTSVHIVTQLESVLEKLQLHSDVDLSFDVLLNSAEGYRSSQKTVKGRVRPDTMVRSVGIPVFFTVKFMVLFKSP